MNNGGKPEYTYTGKDVCKANFASYITNSDGDVWSPSNSPGRVS